MKPVLFHLGEFQLTSYGVSKALAVLVGGWLLGRELRRCGRSPELAWPLAFAAAVGGFVGAKLYYLAENAGQLSSHALGGTGFTWYGGLIGGAAAALIVARRHALSPGLVAGMFAIPLAVAYGIGRIGCLLAGDGTYGTRSDLPWAMSFPHGEMPISEPVHPAPLYEALAAFLIGALLWRLRSRLSPVGLFSVFSVLMGLERLLVEFVRRNHELVIGLTQPQLWSLGLIALGAALGYRELARGRTWRVDRSEAAA